MNRMIRTTENRKVSRFDLFFGILLFLFVISITAACSLPVAAATKDGSYTLYDFNTITGDFVTDDNKKISVELYGEDTVLHIGRLNENSHTAYQPLKIVCTPSKEFNVTEYRSFGMKLYAKVGTDVSCYVSAKITTDEGSIEDIARFDADTWTDVSFQTDFLRGIIRRIEITITADLPVNDREHDVDFYCDRVFLGNPVNRKMTARFLFDEFTVIGESSGTVYPAVVADDKTKITVTLSEQETTDLSANLFINDYGVNTDELRLIFVNDSALDSMTLYYTTRDTAVIREEKSVTIKLLPYSEETCYYADVGNIDMIDSIRMAFGTGKGTVSLVSVVPVSTYQPHEKYNTCGSITSCRLTDNGKTLRFTGEVSRDEALAHQNGKIAIYGIGQSDDTETDFFYQNEPILTSPMTTKFELNLPVGENNSHLITGQFIAVSLHTDGSVMLLDAPFYVGNPEEAAVYNSSGTLGVKGIVSDDISQIGEAAADLTVLEVSMSHVFHGKSGALRYLYHGELYYFDGSYFDVLDLEMTALYNANVSVLLRVTGWDESYVAALNDYYARDIYIDYTGYNSYLDGREYFAALCAYLAERWAAVGKLSGVIIGDCENSYEREVRLTVATEDGSTVTLLSDNTEKSYTLNKLAEFAAKNLRTAYLEFACVDSGTAVWLSVGKYWCDEVVGVDMLVGIDEFIPALGQEMTRKGNFPFGLCLEQYRATDFLSYDGDEYTQILSLLRGRGIYDTRLLVYDHGIAYYESDEEMNAYTLLYYYSAYFGQYISAYIAEIHDNAMGKACISLLSAVDTSDVETASEKAFRYFGIVGWGAVIDGYDRRSLHPHIEEVIASQSELPADIKGRYVYYDFNEMTDISHFNPGYYCSSIELIGTEDSYLLAYLNRTIYADNISPQNHVSYMGISHWFEYAENLRLTPVISVMLRVSDIVAASAVDSTEVKFVFQATVGRCEISATVPTDKWVTVYLPVGSFTGSSDCNGIQIMVAGNSIESCTLSLKSIIGLSREYNDDALSAAITQSRQKRRSGGISDATLRTNYIWGGGIAAVALFTLLTFVILTRSRHDES